VWGTTVKLAAGNGPEIISQQERKLGAGMIMLEWLG
jgi:hypothetical protein